MKKNITRPGKSSAGGAKRLMTAVDSHRRPRKHGCDEDSVRSGASREAMEEAYLLGRRSS